MTDGSKKPMSNRVKDLNVTSFEKMFKPLYGGDLFIADTFLGPDGVRYREVSLYLSLKEVPLLAIFTRNIFSNFSPEFLSICEYNS